MTLSTQLSAKELICPQATQNNILRPLPHLQGPLASLISASSSKQDVSALQALSYHCIMLSYTQPPVMNLPQSPDLSSTAPVPVLVPHHHCTSLASSSSSTPTTSTPLWLKLTSAISQPISAWYSLNASWRKCVSLRGCYSNVGECWLIGRFREVIRGRRDM